MWKPPPWRASISAVRISAPSGPNQRAICAGSIQAAKTFGGGALSRRLSARLGLSSMLQLHPQQMGDLADNAAAEQEHAGDEDRALDHRHPFADLGEVVLHGDDNDGA